MCHVMSKGSQLHFRITQIMLAKHHLENLILNKTKIKTKLEI